MVNDKIQNLEDKYRRLFGFRVNLDTNWVVDKKEHWSVIVYIGGIYCGEVFYLNHRQIVEDVEDILKKQLIRRRKEKW